MPDLFPIFLKLSGRCALVMSSGKVAALRVKQQIKTGARIAVIRPKGGGANTYWIGMIADFTR